jgi:hypothetical protein
MLNRTLRRSGAGLAVLVLLAAAAPIGAARQVEPDGTTEGIQAHPRIFNARGAARAEQLCGPGTETGVPPKEAAISQRTRTGGVNGGPGFRIGKKVPTEKCAAGVIDFTGERGTVLDRLGFDHRGYCGAGAPRFNVSLEGGGFHFVGCAGMTTLSTFTDSEGRTWEKKRANLAALGIVGAEIRDLQIVHDETGSAALDNIVISDAIIRR